MAYNPTSVPLDVERVIGDPSIREYTYPFLAGGTDASGQSDIRVAYDGEIVAPARYRVSVNPNGRGGTITFLDSPAIANPLTLAQNGLLRIYRDTAVQRVATFGTGSYAPAAAVEAAMARLFRIIQELTAREDVRSDTLVEITDIEAFARAPGQIGARTIAADDLMDAVKAFARAGGPGIMLADLGFTIDDHAHSGNGITASDVDHLIKAFARAGGAAIALGDTDFGDTIEGSLDRARCGYDASTRTLTLVSNDGTAVDGFPVVFPEWLTNADVIEQIEKHTNVSGAARFEEALRKETSLFNGNVTFVENEAARPDRGAGQTPRYPVVPTGDFDREIEVRAGGGSWHRFNVQAIRDLPTVTPPSIMNDTNSLSFVEGGITYRVGRHVADDHFVLARSSNGSVVMGIRDVPILIDDSLLEVKEPAKLGSSRKWGDPELPFASAGNRGIVELANQAEADTGTDTTKAMTPALVKRRIDAIPAQTGTGLTENDQAKLDALSGTDVWQDNDAFEVATSDTLQTLAQAAGLTYATNVVQGPRYADPAYIYVRRVTAGPGATLPERIRASIIESQGLFASRLGAVWTAMGVSGGRHYWQVEVDDIPSGAMVRVESKTGLDLNVEDVDIRQWRQALGIHRGGLSVVDHSYPGLTLVRTDTSPAAVQRRISPFFDLDDADKQDGELHLILDLSVAPVSDTNMSFFRNVTVTEQHRQVLLSKIVTPKQVRDADAYTNTSNPGGVVVFRQPLYSANTVLGVYEVRLTRNPNQNQMGIFRRYLGEAGATGATLSADLVVDYAPEADTGLAGGPAVEAVRDAKGPLIAKATIPAGTHNAGALLNLPFTVESDFTSDYNASGGGLEGQRCVDHPGWIAEVWVGAAGSEALASCSWLPANALDPTNSPSRTGPTFRQTYALGCSVPGGTAGTRAVNMQFQRNLTGNAAHRDAFWFYGAGGDAILANTEIRFYQWLGGAKGEKGDKGDPGQGGVYTPTRRKLYESEPANAGQLRLVTQQVVEAPVAALGSGATNWTAPTNADRGKTMIIAWSAGNQSASHVFTDTDRWPRQTIDISVDDWMDAPSAAVGTTYANAQALPSGWFTPTIRAFGSAEGWSRRTALVKGPNGRPAFYAGDGQINAISSLLVEVLG